MALLSAQLSDDRYSDLKEEIYSSEGRLVDLSVVSCVLAITKEPHVTGQDSSQKITSVD